MVINAFGGLFLPQALEEIARGYSTLILAILMSSYLKNNPLITNLSACSFGIYLSHLLVVEAFQIIANRVNPNYINQVSTPILLTISLYKLYD